jgi:hypothetical protein
LGKLRVLIMGVVGLVTLAVLGGLLPGAALAQTAAGGSVSFKNVTLWVYPEYDDPRLLTMLEGKLASGTAPVEVKFLVPSTAEMYSAGSKDASGTYSGGPPARVASDIPGWDEISYQLKTDTFRVEYYDPAISGETDKKISYDFRFVESISDMRVIVQQPLKASNFQVTPAGTATFEGQFAVQTYNITNLDPSEPIHYDISYTKTDSSTSVQPSATSTSAGADNPLGPLVGSGDPGTKGPSNSVGMIVLIIAIVMFGIFAGVMVIARRSVRRPPPRSYATSHRRKNANRNQVQRPGPKKFCNQCGQGIDSHSRFCQHCGSKVASYQA